MLGDILKQFLKDLAALSLGSSFSDLEFFDDALVGEVTQRELGEPVEYLLGRKTFDIWAGYWPQHTDIWPGINDNMKYVLSSTLKETDWKNTTLIVDVDGIRNLKNSDGPDIQVWGSSELVHLLLENDLVDELRIMTFPLILGEGKKVFASGATPASFELQASKTGASGVVIGWYKRAGEVKTGTMPE